MDAPNEVKNARLLSIINRLSEILEPITACESGCSHCCNMAVGITKWEAEQITAHTGVKYERPKLVDMTIDPATAHDDYVGQYMNVVCPFLENNLCSIYEARPFSCRTNFNISSFPKLCDLSTESSVPNFDLTILWRIAAWINMEPPIFGDIREFFPTGKKEK